MSKLEDRVREVTTELLDNLERHERADLLHDYASQLPVAIIAEMLGVPRADAPFLLEWGNHGAALLDIGMTWSAYRDAIQALIEIDRYFDAHLVRLRGELAEDPTVDGILASIVRDGDLNDRELKATMALLLGAGFETTVNLIGNGIAALLRHPQQLAHLRENPDGWPNAVEEILRYDSPCRSPEGSPPRLANLKGTRWRPGPWPYCCWAAPIVIRRFSISPMSSMSSGPTHANTWRSVAASTCASERAWPGWKAWWRCNRCSSASQNSSWRPTPFPVNT